MNNEISRLRQLRKKALKLRALALALDAGKRNEMYESAAVLSWRIARIATGKLRSHPFRSYQQDPGYLESAADRFDAYLQGVVANLRGRGMQVFLQALGAASRELDDARALTLSTDLSDSLGRAQKDMRTVIGEVRTYLCWYSSQNDADCGKQKNSRLAVTTPGASPYLAL